MGAREGCQGLRPDHKLASGYKEGSRPGISLTYIPAAYPLCSKSRCLIAVEQRRRSAKKDVAARSTVGGYLSRTVGQECRHNGGWMRVRAWVDTMGKEGLEKLDSQFIISQRPTPQPLCRAWVLGHAPVPSLQMWIRLPVVPQRAAPGADLGG